MVVILLSIACASFSLLSLYFFPPLFLCLHPLWKVPLQPWNGPGAQHQFMDSLRTPLRYQVWGINSGQSNSLESNSLENTALEKQQNWLFLDCKRRLQMPAEEMQCHPHREMIGNFMAVDICHQVPALFQDQHKSRRPGKALKTWVKNPQCSTRKI